MGNSDSKPEGSNQPRGLAPDGSLPNNFEFFLYSKPGAHIKIGREDDFWYTIEMSSDLRAFKLFRGDGIQAMEGEPLALLGHSWHPASKYTLYLGDGWNSSPRFTQQPSSDHWDTDNRFAARPSTGAPGDEYGLKETPGEGDRLWEYLKFTIPSPHGAGSGAGSQTFAWRRAHRADGKEAGTEHSTSYGYKLVREDGAGKGEVVGLFMWMSLSGAFGKKVGWFEFEGSARNGALGEVFGAMTLLSMSRMVLSYFANSGAMGRDIAISTALVTAAAT